MTETFSRKDFAKRQIQTAALDLTSQILKLTINVLIAQGVLNKKLFLVLLSQLHDILEKDIAKCEDDIAREIIEAKDLMLKSFMLDVNSLPEPTEEQRAEL